tara:strand:- start:296 stop:415 length:120 start_codon:yes stop_codon:yes gene_type:complete
MARDTESPRKKRVTKGDRNAKKYFSRYKKGGPKKKRVKL